MSRRQKTSYPGVFFREAKRIGGPGKERVYYVVFKKNGKVREEKVGRQHADAMTPAKAAGIRAERVEGKRQSRKEIREREQALKDAEAARWTMDRLWEEYSSGRPASKGHSTDRNRYDKHIKPIFGKKEPKDLIALDVDRLRIKLLKTRKPQTVKHVLALLKRIVHFGENKHLCEGIAFKIEMPKVNNLRTEDLTPEQVGNLLRVIDEDSHAQAGPMMKLALFTGLRRGELFKMRWQDVDLERGFISILDPKGGPDQMIPINDPAEKLLKSHPRTDSPYVFPGRDGEQRANIYPAVNKIKRAAGLPADFRPLHGIRHVYASMLASSGQVDMYALQKLMTHKSPIMTQRYAHLRDEALRRASDLAGDLIVQAQESIEEKVVSIEDEE